jgi:hypothetical protein
MWVADVDCKMAKYELKENLRYGKKGFRKEQREKFSPKPNINKVNFKAFSKNIFLVFIPSSEVN